MKFMTKHFQSLRANQFFAILFLFVIFAHCLLLIDDGVYFDEWQFDSVPANLSLLAQLEKDTARMGFPQAGYYIWGIFALPRLLQNIISFLVPLATAFILIKILREINIFKAHEVKLIAIFSVLYPGVQTYLENIQLIYALSTLLHLFGWMLIFRSANSIGINAKQNIVASIAILISFTTGSFLVFHYAFLLLYLFKILKITNGVECKLQNLAKVVIYACLPLLYYFVMRFWLFPITTPNMPNYNQPSVWYIISPQIWWYFIQNGIVGILNWSFQEVISFPAFVLFVSLFQPFRSAFSKELNSNNPKSDFRVLYIIGLIGLGMAMLPYAAVGKPSDLHGLTTRSNLLIGLPISIIFLAVFRQFRSVNIKQHPLLEIIAVLLILIGFMLSHVHNYISWQSRWVLDRSILLNLSESTDVKKYKIFSIEDKYGWLEREDIEYYLSLRAPYTWEYMIRRSLEGDQYLLDENSYYLPDFFENRNRPEYKTGGCRAKIVIERGKRTEMRGGATVSSVDLFTRYLFIRFFQPSKMNDFLRENTKVSIVDTTVGGCKST